MEWVLYDDINDDTNVTFYDIKLAIPNFKDSQPKYTISATSSYF